MNITTKQKYNEPVLRFPEFSGKWEVKKLSDVARITTGSTPSTSNSKYYGGHRLFVSPADLAQNRYIFETKTTLTESGFLNGREVQKGSVLFVCIGSTIGKVGQCSVNCLTNQQINALFAKSHSLNDFIFSLLEKKAPRIKLMAGVQAIPQINKSDFSKFKFNFPNFPEQQKIASFLTSVDTKIEQLRKKKSLLEKYKKGMMQKLFNQELCFKDNEGNDYPDWKEMKLSDETKVYDGTHQTPKYVKSGVPFYSVEHITADQFSKTKFISEEVFEQERNRVAIEKGDILMTRIGSVGVAKYISWDVRASFYVSLALIKVSSKIVGEYLAQYITDDSFQRELWKRTIHVAFPIKINLGEIGNCFIRIPKQEEQQKIANFLSALDQKIDLVTSELKQAQTFKKGLLQQMFV